MDILHILRSAPDATTEKMMSELSNDERSAVIKLYEAGPAIQFKDVPFKVIQGQLSRSQSNARIWVPIRC